MKQSGIYCILNTANGKRYYGSTIDWARNHLGYFG
jgi:hypothetical protein